MIGDYFLSGAIVKSTEFVPKQNRRGKPIPERLIADVYSVIKGQASILKTTMWGKMAKLHSQTLTPGTKISAMASMHCFTSNLRLPNSTLGPLVTKVGFTISRVGCLEKAGIELMWMYELLRKATNRGLSAWYNRSDGSIRGWNCPSCGSEQMLCFKDTKGDGRPRLYACECGHRKSTSKWTKDRLEEV